MIAIIKYNAGNVESVQNALNRLGVESIITDKVEEIKSAKKVILPGVGEASSAMNYLKERGLDEVIKNLYDDRKSHIQNFILESLKTLYKDKCDEYPGDSTVKNILLNIFQDDELCKTRLSSEIKLHQQKMRGEKSDYNKIF